MSSNYRKFIDESTYKALVNKANTNYNLSWYEEQDNFTNHTNIESIWIDSNYIPYNAPVLNNHGIYTVNNGISDIGIIEKIENIELEKSPFYENVYYNSLLINSIPTTFGNGYNIKIIDSNNEEIPFGLNQWIIDSNNGYLIFLKGWPNGYSELPRISFYRYVGRIATDNLLLKDGSILLDSNYKPTQNSSITTKEYVDNMVSTINDNIDKLIPREPDNIDNKELVLEAQNYITCSPWNSEEKINMVFFGDDWQIRLPQIYLPESGMRIEILLNNKILDEISITEDLNFNSSFFIVDSIVDPYENSKVANSFYKSINSHVIIDEATIKNNTSSNAPYITITIKQHYNFKSYTSLPITIGFEEKVKLPLIYNISLDWMDKNKADYIKYISGVPSLNVDSNINLRFLINEIQLYKNSKVGEICINGNIEEICTKDYYNEAYPAHYYDSNIEIKENSYFEKLNMLINANDVTLINNIAIERHYNIRVDTTSDESDRIISPNGDNFNFSKWTDAKSKEDLHNSNELQLLDGKYQWPAGNYMNNGTFEEYNSDNISLEIPSGPDYSDIVDGTRYATFKVNLSLCNGFYFNFVDDENINSSSLTKIYDIKYLRCILRNETGWLDMLRPYEGVCNPVNDGDGCLVISSSSIKTKYFTFGNKPLSGELYIVVGIEKSDIKFSGINVIPNY